MFRIFFIIVLKPIPTQRVDPGPGWPGSRTGPGLSKNPSRSWPGKTRSIRNSGDPVKPGWDPISFYIYIYIAGNDVVCCGLLKYQKFWLKTMQMKDEGWRKKDAKLQIEITRKSNFNRIAHVPVILLLPKHDISFIGIPIRSRRFHWKQYPRFWSDPASRHDWKSPSLKFRMLISVLLLMHDCCCFLFWCTCVLSLFKIFFFSLPSILNLKRMPICGWLKENVNLWLESWKTDWWERDQREKLYLLKFLFDFILGWFIEVFIWFFLFYL